MGRAERGRPAGPVDAAGRDGPAVALFARSLAPGDPRHPGRRRPRDRASGRVDDRPRRLVVTTAGRADRRARHDRGRLAPQRDERDAGGLRGPCDRVARTRGREGPQDLRHRSRTQPGPGEPVRARRASDRRRLRAQRGRDDGVRRDLRRPPARGRRDLARDLRGGRPDRPDPARLRVPSGARFRPPRDRRAAALPAGTRAPEHDRSADRRREGRRRGCGPRCSGGSREPAREG